jgi:hypothetical protein
MPYKHAETIVNFTRKMWNYVFYDNKVPPLTLVYDPESSFRGALAGFFHIAHDYLPYCMHHDINPDDYIYFINPVEPSFEENRIDSIGAVPTIECLVICSFKNADEITDLIEKITPDGLVIVLNEIITIQKNITLLESNNSKLSVKSEQPILSGDSIKDILWDIKAYKVTN